MRKSLPAKWSTVELDDLVTVCRPRADPREFPDMPFVGMDNVEAHTMRLLGTVPAGTMRSNATHFYPQDILYGRLRPYLNKVLAPTFEGLASAEFIPLTPEPGIDRDFLRYRVNAADFVSFTSHLDEGDRPRVDWNGIRQFQVSLPPSAEQGRIVEIVDSYVTRLDAAVTSLERVQAKLKAYRASVLKAAVEGRLVPTEASLSRAENRAYEGADALLARVLKERRRRWEEAELARLKVARKTPRGDEWKAKYEEPAAPDTGKLTALPEGWCWTSLGALIVDGPQNGLYVPKSQYGEGTPILRIDDYQVDWSRSASELQRVRVSVHDEARFGLSLGDLVLNRVNSPSHLGKTLAVEARHLPAVFESNMMRFAPSGALSSRFLHFYLSSAQGKERLTAGAKWAVNQASINQQDVGNTAVPLPPESEQLRIVAEIDRLLSAAEAVAAMVEQNARRSDRLRQAVLKWAFEGKLVDQDPEDEPAETLVTRLRAERAAVAPARKNGGRRAKGAA